MNTEIARKTLDKTFSRLRSVMPLKIPPKGWIKAVRNALGMTTAQLAKRMGISQSSLTTLEQNEIKRTISLARLERVAEALDCTLVYAFIPHHSLEQTVRQKAKEKARDILAHIHRTMALEAQGLTKEEMEEECVALAETLLRENMRRLWDDTV
jgi:predicted DNA-binding mobile mystery protein A